MLIAPPGKVLIFAAHHDDETISCAGTIKKLSDLGSKITVVFGTDGATGIDHTGKYEKSSIASTRVLESKRVAKLLGINKTIDWSEPCQHFENSKTNLHKAMALIRKVRPDLVLTHSEHEKHRDHKNMSNLIKESCWKASEDIMPELGKHFRVPDLWAFEVVDPLDKVDFCVDISKQIKIKIEAMNIYESQINVVSGINQYITGLAMTRGYSIGSKYAEAFKKND
jgi:LmbE family N-acetylglucosaminyl deacetylase